MKLLAPLTLLLAFSLGCALGDKGEDDGDLDDVEETGRDDDDDGDTNDDEDDTDDDEEEPTTGPGVLGDETGLEAMCRRFFECGGGYYSDEEDCMDASYNYWGDCPAVVAALDALGACVAEVDCDEYNPDSYHPSSIGCGDEWEDLGQAECR